MCTEREAAPRIDQDGQGEDREGEDWVCISVSELLPPKSQTCRSKREVHLGHFVQEHRTVCQGDTAAVVVEATPKVRGGTQISERDLRAGGQSVLCLLYVTTCTQTCWVSAHAWIVVSVYRHPGMGHVSRVHRHAASVHT